MTNKSICFRNDCQTFKKNENLEKLIEILSKPDYVGLSVCQELTISDCHVVYSLLFCFKKLVNKLLFTV